MYKLRSNKDYFTGNHIRFSIENTLAKTKKPEALASLFNLLMNNSLEVTSNENKFYLIDARASYSLLFLFPFYQRIYLYILFSTYERDLSLRYVDPYEVKTNIPSLSEVISLTTTLLDESYSSKLVDKLITLEQVNTILKFSVDSKIFKGTLENRLNYLFNYFEVEPAVSTNFIKISVENSKYFAASVIINYFAIPQGEKILNNIEAWLSQNTLTY